MEKEKAMKIAKEILEELDCWVNLDSLYEPSCNGDGTYYDECVEIVANIILEGVNKNGRRKEFEELVDRNIDVAKRLANK